MLRTFGTFLLLGLRGFGGPAAHLALFRAHFVEKRKLLTAEEWGEVLSICQFLPGPTSSQVGILLGRRMAGNAGAFAAWLGFTLPAALLMTALAWAGRTWPRTFLDAHWTTGLRAGAMAGVLQAVLAMAGNFWKGRLLASVGVGAAVLSLVFPAAWGHIPLLLLCALAGSRSLPSPLESAPSASRARDPWKRHLFALVVLFAALPLAASWMGSPAWRCLWTFVKAGGLVFGGGHVVLPLLQSSFVPEGWVSAREFLDGYGLAQAMPGPLFSIACWLGALATPFPGIWAGSLLGLAAIYLPSVPLLGLSLRAWSWVRARSWARGAVAGICAGSTGILAAALWPLGRECASSPLGAGLALVGAVALWRKAPAWSVPLGCALVAAIAG